MEVQLIAAGKVVLFVIAALLPIVNPLSSAPIFLAMTTWCSTDMRQALARRIAVNGFNLLLVVDFYRLSHSCLFWYLPAGGASRWWLAGCSYGLAAFRLSRRPASRPPMPLPGAPDEIVRRAFYPLTLPLTVGPGSISVAITLGANTTRTHIDLWAFYHRDSDCHHSGRGFHLFLLPVRREHGPATRSQRHEYFSSAVLLHPALHRCADFLERRQRVLGSLAHDTQANRVLTAIFRHGNLDFTGTRLWLWRRRHADTRHPIDLQSGLIGLLSPDTFDSVRDHKPRYFLRID